jgi:hypothetical protein
VTIETPRRDERVLTDMSDESPRLEVGRKGHLSHGYAGNGGERFPWAWVLGLSGLAILFWLGSELRSRPGPPSAIPGSAVERESRAPSRKLTQFVEFARAAHVPPPESRRRYVDAGMHRLTAALDDIAGSGPRDPVADRGLAALRKHVADLAAGGGGANGETESVREAFLLATSAMDEIAADRIPGARPLVKIVGEVAESIDTDRPLDSQMQKVEDFFRQAGYAVIALAPSSAMLAEAGG